MKPFKPRTLTKSSKEQLAACLIFTMLLARGLAGWLWYAYGLQTTFGAGVIFALTAAGWLFLIVKERKTGIKIIKQNLS